MPRNLPATTRAERSVLSKRGFTLVELLVVVGIIILLAGILVPSLQRGFAAAQRGKCAANLKSIGTALSTYLNDSIQRVYPATAKTYLLFGQLGNAPGYNATYSQQATDVVLNPNSDADNDGVPDSRDPDYSQDVSVRPLNKYLGYTTDGSEVEIGKCPSDQGGTNVLDHPDTNDGIFTNDGENNTTTNVFRATGTSYIDAAKTRFGIDAAFGPTPLDAASTKPPASKIMVGDAPLFGDNKYSDDIASTPDKRNRWHMTDPKRRMYNILYADGHVEFYEFKRDDNDKPVIETLTQATTGRPELGFW